MVLACIKHCVHNNIITVLAGRPGADGAVISWNECAWQNLNNGLDYGLITVGTDITRMSIITTMSPVSTEQVLTWPQRPTSHSAFGVAFLSHNTLLWISSCHDNEPHLLQECQYYKQLDYTWLRVTWIGNMRITRCEGCCMRWFFTINGEECADPGMYNSTLQ